MKDFCPVLSRQTAGGDAGGDHSMSDEFLARKIFGRKAFLSSAEFILQASL
jgi:hypothetical protein